MLDQIVNSERFNPANYVTSEQIDEWIGSTRHKVTFRDEAQID